jgi:short-subunit dehydrogenase
MTAVNTFKMPFLMKADRAARLIVKALERKKKVYNFPWQTRLLMRIASWLPDWALERVFEGKTGDRPKPSL